MRKKGRSFNNLSVKKKLLLGFVVSSIFILGMGAISLLSIYKAKDTAFIRAELEHQVSLIRNVRLHLLTYKVDRANYRPRIVRNEFASMLKTNSTVVELLSGEEKSIMDSIHLDLKIRAQNIDMYLDNALVYDSIVGQMLEQTREINKLINKNNNSIIANGVVNDKLQWLHSRLLYSKLRPGQLKYKDILSPVKQLSEALKNSGHTLAFAISKELAHGIEAFKDVYEKEKEFYIRADNKFPDVVSYINALIKKQSTKNEHELNLIWNLVLVLSVIGALAVYAISRYTSNSTVQAIASLEKISTEVSQGKIGVVIPVQLLRRKDEIGSLANSYHQMLGQFRTVVCEITKSATEILTAGDNLKESSQFISVSATQQAMSLEEISSTVEEIVSNIQQNVGNANSTKKKAELSTEGLKQLKEQNEKVYKSSLDVDEKTKIISEMAFQTNILSLNAAVEAAVAGVHGKAFGVVAAEVKKLAQRSNEAAGIIVCLTKDGIELTKMGSKLAVELLPEMEATYHLVNEIAVASQEQLVGVEQINMAIGTLNSVSQENSVRAEQLAQNAVYLNEQSDKLKSVIDFFSLNVVDVEEDGRSFLKMLKTKLRLVIKF